MAPPKIASPLWLHALTLAERNSVLAIHNSHEPYSHQRQPDAGRRRLERWRAQSPFSLDSYFAQRLALDGMTPERLLDIFSEPIETLQGVLPDIPPWLAQIEEAFAGAVSRRDDDEEQEPFDDALDDASDLSPDEDSMPDDELLAFLVVIQPLIDHACDRLRAAISTITAKTQVVPFDLEAIEDILLVNLLDPLLMRLSRTLVLELHVARLQGHLAGETPQERFESFIQRLSSQEVAMAILAEYPVMARQLTICLNHWVEVSLEFIERLCSDWALIRTHFSPHDDPGLLVEVAGGAGDTHRDGRSVMIATFESGFRIVYKPKSLKIDQHFQELLTWLNDKGCEPPLQTLTVLDRGDYGWVEFVVYQSCRTKEELVRFFQRHGAYLALLYALNSNDFHYENLIAAGENPLLIDLETLLQPTFDTFDETQADFLAEKLMMESVLQIGLLPMRLWSSDDYAGIDISGLGGMTGQLSPDRLPQLTDVGTDAMRYIRERIEVAGVANRPSLNGVEADPTDYVEHIVAGFTTIYQRLMLHRDELLSPNGPIERFAQDEIRVLLRPTRTYDQLLSESFHPDLLHDALDRQLFLDRLWMAATFRPYLAQVIASEQAEMQQGDIPLFTSRPNSLELVGFRGMEISGVLYETGMSAVRRRIGQLSEQDMRRQLWFIRASIATLESGTPPSLQNNAPASEIAVPEAAGIDPARLLSASQHIADHLAETAIYGMDDVSWFGLDLMNQQNWTVRTIGPNLSSGLSGVTLFMAYAGAITGSESYTLLARRGQRTLVGQMEILQSEMPATGAFEGWGSLLYTLTHLATLWGDEGILYQAKGIAAIIGDLVPQDDRFDIARGCAGALVTLLALHRIAPQENILQAAIACGKHLLAAASPTEQGIRWTIPSTGAKPHNAFLHGREGIGCALLELAAITGDERYASVGKQAISELYTLNTSTTAEQVNAAKQDISTTVGIALSCLSALRHLNDAGLAETLEMATSHASSSGLEHTHSLLQGEMGILDTLIQTSQRHNNARLRAIIARRGSSLLERIETEGWRCSGPNDVESPGLMMGLAGIGYGLLRLAAPERVPAVLALASPIPQSGVGQQSASQQSVARSRV